MAQLLVGAVRPLQSVLEVHRKGGGVEFDEYGSDLREGQAAFNYPAFWTQLPEEWLPSITDVHARLESEPPARVADLGCGYGWSSLGMARGYPKVQVRCRKAVPAALCVGKSCAGLGAMNNSCFLWNIMVR